MKKLIAWMVFFAVMCSLDILLTDFFLTNSIIEESNPIAKVYHENWGIYGLITLKGGSFLIVSLVCMLLAKRNNILFAQRIAIFGSIVVSLIVGYSFYGVCCVWHEHQRFLNVEHQFNELQFNERQL